MLAAQIAVGASAASLIAAGADCPTELDAYCQSCPTGAEAGCELLFGPGTEAVTCGALDANPNWRAHYCAWRGAATEPWVRLLFLQSVGCWDPSVTVRDLASLLLAIPSVGGDCAARLTNGLMSAATDLELVLGAPHTTNREGSRVPWALRDCAEWLENVACAACTPDPEGECVGFFTSSAGASDCFDLRRSESMGGGFAAMCAWDYNLAFIQRECANLYEPCYDGRFYGPNAKSYENLVAAFPGFFDPRRRDRCIDQWQACRDEDPFHDVDVSRAVPTAAIEQPAEEESKCPG